MKAPKVRLYIRIRRPDGSTSYLDPAWNANRTLRRGYATVDGKSVGYPNGSYYLRYLSAGKRLWESVGPDPDGALVALRNKEHDLQALALGRPPSGKASSTEVQAQLEVATSASISLDQAVADYLEEIRRFRAPKTLAGCKHTLKLLQRGLPNKMLKDITRKELLNHMSSLKDQGLSNRTAHNHVKRILTFLRSQGVVGLLRATDIPRYEERDAQAYKPEQLALLLAAADPEERIVFEFFLGTGLREQEVMYTTWKNINFKDKVVDVRSKPELGFHIKDKEERSVPVPEWLIAKLIERKKQSSSMLVFPSSIGKANGHFLRVLQKLAYRAGLNCGECVTKSEKSCANHPVCTEWGLHKFRKTFATLHSEAGVSVRTIQKWCGHSSLSCTLKYLAAADLRSERTRNQVNASFAMLNLGAA
ncbi:tyrosine-type recombinase/integrase [Granulicella tundricola]|uniref:Integrase family protein n=1 Tax=Granulicella tundricola (strain ATCC BAA-1859 / DSM 23138 / MP5ACTX9) TaxID=1198114 RepID=E8X4X8_GRATM|nr:site-specific integrase [Granulicella tundricola]ADW67170.1 integrase family protein [Granulicella tundricola MP5ACTX9]